MRTLAVGLCVILATTSCDLISKDGTSKESGAEKAGAAAATAAGAEGWTQLFDGKTLDGWKVNENPASWSVKDGLLVANGQRSHIFYVGAKEPFVNFELEAMVMTKPNSNSGIYIHTQYQDSGWPKYGFEVQVNNSFPDPQKTAASTDQATTPKAQAQCCAKVSRATMGCHD